MSDNTMRGYFRRGSEYAACVPDGRKDIGPAFSVWWHVCTPAGWEEIELSKRADGKWRARYVEQNKNASMQRDGSLETRDAGADGGMEGFIFAEQPGNAGDPNDWSVVLGYVWYEGRCFGSVIFERKAA